MKKTIVLQGIFSLLLFTVSCRKDVETGLPSAATSPKARSAGATLSPGQIHNNLLSEYLDTYGLPADELITFDEARAGYLAIVQIAENQGLGNTALTPAQEADALLAYHVEAGFFKNGVLLTPEEAVARAIQQEQNAAVRAAYVQICGLAQQGGDDWIENAQQTLASLTGLTLAEQETVDGFGSVLENSCVLWNGKTLADYRKAFVAVCDAIGYKVGKEAEARYHEEMRYEAEYGNYPSGGVSGYYVAENLHWAEKTAAQWSAQAAR